MFGNKLPIKVDLTVSKAPEALTPSPSPNTGRGEQDPDATCLSPPSPKVGRGGLGG
ncbi:MAG: hypothetical protein HC851_11240 [Acaryochloris sp. RU_4_1]|nr:hypothetical protein [Acaryochloris sp. RU_4_1]